ncbi:MAG: DUF58 domain-containing protein [Deltaproteobacteria bacterium]|nr:DUF58 domain-containing protein [Deltaproteobacteria bacterium]
MLRRFLFHSFGSLFTFDRWVRKRFTNAGLLTLVGLIASAVVGLDTNRTVAFQAFTFLLSLLVISVLWGLFSRSRFKAYRKLPRFVTAGEQFHYNVVIENKTGKDQKNLTVFENPARRFPTYQEFLQAPEPENVPRNAFDRKVGYHRWVRLVHKKQGSGVEEHPVPVLSPNDRKELKVEILPLNRGRLTLKGLTVARPDPFGLFKSFDHIPLMESVMVLPKRYPLPPIHLSGTRTYQPGGVSLAQSVGDSEEFLSVRDYRPGDPLRRIHWKSWAKTGKPVVKEYQDEFFVRHALILDTFQEAAYSDTFEEAVSVAASFACSIQTQDSLLDLMFAGPEAFCFTSGRGLAHEDQMLEILASVTPATRKTFSILSALVIERASLLSGCICIMLAWDPERQKLVEYLRGLGLPVLVLVVSQEEAFPPLDPGPMGDRPENLHRLRVGNIEKGLAGL